MTDQRIVKVEGHSIVRSGSLTCPSPDACDRHPHEKFEAYVERHCYDHSIDLAYSENAERNLGLWCGYFDHKYIWGNPTLTPQPFWELHAFTTEWSWSSVALETDRPVSQRTFRVPDASTRGAVEYRRFKQIEVPRQCQKTTIGARWYSVWRSRHEYFINDRRNFRTIIRSATGKNTRDTLAVIRRMASKQTKIAALYGIWVARCTHCGKTSQHYQRMTGCRNPECKKELKNPPRRISLVNDSLRARALGQDMVSFRWLTDAEDVDAVAAYSIWVAGLESETTGQRPDLYIWDDPQTDKNSDTPEKRAKIIERFDESVRQLEIPGELLVLDTRKYPSDFAGKISEQPLRDMFWTLHRRVRWRTDEPEDPPYVVKGFRYYYPKKGDGKTALNASAVDDLERQMIERQFSAEYMNDPLDTSKALFKREWFRLIDPEDAPPEVRYGLGREVYPQEQIELDALNVRIIAYNACDPASKSQSSRTGDDTFIVGLRVVPRFQAFYVTYLAAGQWAPSRKWDEIEKANRYNRPLFTDYECPNDEDTVKDSFEKWCRERSEELSAGGGTASVMIPMLWSPMPKSRKTERIEAMEPLMKNGGFFILKNAASEELIEKYIGQWLGLKVVDHDDGPDATSRLHDHIVRHYYQAPPKVDADPVVKTENGVSTVPVTLISEMATTVRVGGLWGDRGW